MTEPANPAGETAAPGSAGSATHEGGCLCGIVRFTVQGPPVRADWCHCRECQRSSGSAAIPWGAWPAESFRITEGEHHLSCFSSTYRGQRHFCRECGATLHMTDPTEERGTVGVPLTALDDPTVASPTCHSWVSERVPWAQGTDDLPVHEKDMPE
ncbi:hypothetical protein C882_2161 [Caenispirillum salinarum AK4]|uniref:CENP-V/GFA domain-containing protein n=1 Tax=Caenispirillum salinarum AK4 TaxID=1238182 RepID=K9GP66_9PROT|nr:GFA family protein [Caenispirillum salinarum]EKV26937.1 hypothetical protein C882_2161 [Caenispirillum salinarum AK4]